MADSVPAVLGRLAQADVSVQWRDGKAVFKAAAEPPPDVVALIDARKADISAFLHPDAVRRRLEAKAEVLRAPRPPDVTDGRWETALDGLRAFIGNGYADEAQRLGWPRDELFAVPPLWARVDLCGAALLIGDREVVDITSNEIRIKTASGATTAFYRKPQVDYGVAYRARLKQIGDDALNEENRAARARGHGRPLPQPQSQRRHRCSQRSCAGRHRARFNQGDERHDRRRPDLRLLQARNRRAARGALVRRRDPVGDLR